MSNLSQSVLDKIFEAQSVSGIPPTQPMVPYKNIGDLLEQQVDTYEQKPFLIFYDDEGRRKEYSYREFFEEVTRTANYLQSAGIQPGDRIATVSFNHSDVVIQYFAAFLLGAVVVPINVGEDDKRIAYILQNSETKLAFVRDQFLERICSLKAQVPGLRSLVQVGRKFSPDLPHFQTELVKQPLRFTPSRRAQLTDEALIVYTSGTTGLPKGVVLLQYNLLVDAMAIAEWHRISDDQRMMCVLPIHHVNGTIVTLMTPLYAGSGVVLNQKFHSEKFFERISMEKVTVVSVVPTLLQFLLHAKLSMEAYKLLHFRHIICGAGPLTVELALKFEHEFKIPIIHGYGLSETTCYSCFLPIDLSLGEHKMWLSKYKFPSIGVPLPVNEMAIHDEHGNDLGEDERGEIVIRGHNVMKYYFLNSEANERTFAHGWFRSGDEGFFKYDDQGRKFFFITGRIKELIIRGGVNISPFEIDEVLMNMPGIQTGMAVGFENDWYGEEVGAYVKLKDGAQISPEHVIAYCRKHLPFGKSPKVVVFGQDIPVTSTGKYQRNRCKELFAKWKATQFNESKE
ncbi:MAG: Acyl-CoA synthetase (AMP-forming)/AMP-acid ligase [Bacteroidetes bacterium]|nr:Acyl-CoA synthetase (AMP-forming)/AMP-acid ligase [Bacteroidota bacterium]